MEGDGGILQNCRLWPLHHHRHFERNSSQTPSRVAVWRCAMEQDWENDATLLLKRQRMWVFFFFSFLHWHKPVQITNCGIAKEELIVKLFPVTFYNLLLLYNLCSESNAQISIIFGHSRGQIFSRFLVQISTVQLHLFLFKKYDVHFWLKGRR